MYKIIFQDGEEFIGGKSLLRSRWNEMPLKPILSIDYTVGNQTLSLKGFEAYNHLTIHAKGVNKKINCITEFILLGAYCGEVTLFSFDLIKKHIIINKSYFGQEYNGSKSVGWKIGIGTFPQYEIK